ncbi:M48 family metallopeptidase [Leptothermofonsia sp. ETS-13]|uniref:M48 family metallopeptidase n=1 Tax=Leptothermofonsia sp. ETS-13 TaxID=3035696 RepID=UPI003BA2F0C9
MGARSRAGLGLWHPGLFWTVAIPTVVVIGVGSLYKLMVLSQGGSIITQEMGGRLITPDTPNPAEYQLLNIVEEMAIASGISVPAVYVLDGEPGINAFAAGFTPNDAVIGVTRGCMEILTRDELQGVIGHEFSHILNGDMRLNLRLVGVLNGILLIYILGRLAIEVRSGRDRNGNGIALFGLALLIIGSVGLFFGRVIKAAVSRQREFLADASAVQFTRNPDGISAALRKIATHHSHSLVQSPYAEGNSHLFFGSALRFDLFGDLFATHPPLEERIHRLEGSIVYQESVSYRCQKFPPPATLETCREAWKNWV